MWWSHAFHDELSFRVGDHRISYWDEMPHEVHCVIYGGTEAPANVALYLLDDLQRGYVCVNRMRSQTFNLVRDARHTVDMVMDLYNRIHNGRYDGRPLRHY